MHGRGKGRLATGTLAEFDHSYADTIAELGYPTRSAPRAWRDGHEGTGEVPAGRFATNPRHAAGTGRRAAGHYPGHGRGPAGTTGALGYPKSRERPSERAGELAPGRRRHRGPRPGREATPPEGKVRVVAGPGARDGSACVLSSCFEQISHRNLSMNRTGIGQAMPDSGVASVTSRRCPRMVGLRPAAGPR